MNDLKIVYISLGKFGALKPNTASPPPQVREHGVNFHTFHVGWDLAGSGPPTPWVAEP